MLNANRELYDSSHVRDYAFTLAERLERELVYWMAPENVRNEGYWIAHVVSAVEWILLFEELAREVGIGDFSINLSDKVSATQRWRNTFFGVWDGEWQDNPQFGTPRGFGKLEFRKEHRLEIWRMFDFLVEMSKAHTQFDSAEEIEFPELLEDLPQPYFSGKYWSAPTPTSIDTTRFTYDMIGVLGREIIHWLAIENREDALSIEILTVFVAVDLLGIMCQRFETSLVAFEHVEGWRETSLKIWQEREALENWGDTADSDSYIQTIHRSFNRLADYARQHPPMWKDVDKS